ncbi:hypothetical protein KOY48_03625 [Candidatus Minimicrobia naudis]|uniref:Uncharacterized protein n=1 Tax=Candidatus Minimicrobia naudis TaxID=2841263 RepID=A0A8F1MAV7_9BACT|nr:hypothetical protein KOY48_03625 [Candidatus Minimicrobia naudis]
MVIVLREIAKWYKSIFGDRYYLELQDHGHPEVEYALGCAGEDQRGLD